MAVSITINKKIIEDESGINDDLLDNNVTQAFFTGTNPSSFNAASKLSTAIAADGVVLPTVNTTYFPTYAEEDGVVGITGATGTVDVSFSDTTGKALNGAESGLTTDAGTKIYLYTSSNNNIVYGIAQSSPGTITSGTLVFAIVLQETVDGSGNPTGGNFWIEQWQPIHNDSDSGTPDDQSKLIAGSLFVAATQEIVFSDFSTAPSGQDVWAGIRPASELNGSSPVDILATGLNPNVGDTVNVSTTGLGSNAQSVGVGVTLRIDFVSDVFVANSSQAHDESFLSYSQHVLTHGAGWSPVQMNPTNARANAIMAAYDYGNESQGTAYFDDLANNTAQNQVNITSVTVFGKTGTPLGTRTSNGMFTGDTKVSVTFNADGTAEVDGLLSDYRVEFTTSGDMDRFTVKNVSSKRNISFDVGRIVGLDTGHSTADASLNVAFEDDGPTAAIALNTGVTVTHDESAGAQTAGGATDTSNATVAALFTSVTNASTDNTNDDPSGTIYAQSASAVVNSTGSKSGADFVNATTKFSLSLSSSSGVDSGLATTDGKEIWLFKDSTSGLVIGRIGSGANGATADPNGLAAIAVALNADSGVLSLAQYASIKHGSADTGSDISEPAKITDTALQAVVTVTDGDLDQATASKDIGNRVVILDDGPTASITLVSGVSVTHDETPGVDSGSNDTGSAAVTALFANVGNKSSQLSTDTAPFAQNGAIVTTANSSFGADEEGASVAKVVSFVNPNGADSGLQTTDGTKILLFQESSGLAGEDLVVGRIGSQSGQAAFAVAIDQSGVVSVAQYASLKHLITTNPNDSVSITDSALKAMVTVTDGDGDTATGSVNIGNEIKFLDDGPSIVVNSNTKPTLQTTDPLAPATSSSHDNFGADFTPTYGADGQGATPVSYALSLGSTSSGLTDSLSGQSVVLSVNANGSLVTGKTQTSLLTVFTVGVDGTGEVTLTQNRAVKQGSGESPDQGELVSISGTNVVVLNAKATDGDGDSATANLDLTSQLKFKDVGPDITVANILNGTYAAGGSSTWTENPNADGFKSLNVTLNDYTIDSHSTVTVNGSLGTDTTTDANGNYAFNGTINDDFNGDGKSDTVAFKLTFNPNNNTYKIDVTTPPQTIQTFDTSQGSLAAGGPDPVQTLTFSSGPAAGQSIVFFAALPTAPQTNGTVDNPPKDIEDLVGLGLADPTETQIQSFLGPPNQIPSLINASTQLNVSTSGIGVNNNNLDTGESFVVNPSLLVDKVTVFIDNSVGGYTPNSEELDYSVYYKDGTVDAPKKVQVADLHPVTSGPAKGGQSFDISDVAGGPQIDAVQLTMVSGTIKVPVIQFSIAQTFTPQSLNMNLTATLTDGDNDTSKQQFSIALA